VRQERQGWPPDQAADARGRPISGMSALRRLRRPRRPDAASGAGSSSIGCAVDQRGPCVRWFGARRADDRLDGGPAAQLAFDLGCHAPFLAGDEDLELVIGRRFVAAVSLVGEDRRLRANPGKSRSMVCSVLSCSATALRM
jgi:hypothetical protein